MITGYPVIPRVAAKVRTGNLRAMNQKPASMSDTIRLDKQALRLQETRCAI